MRTRNNLALHELIGLEAHVEKSICPEYEGLHGVVVDETKNTFVFETKRKEVTVPKNCCAFRFVLDGESILIDGKTMMYRPEERTKKLKLKG